MICNNAWLSQCTAEQQRQLVTHVIMKPLPCTIWLAWAWWEFDDSDEVWAIALAVEKRITVNVKFQPEAEYEITLKGAKAP